MKAGSANDPAGLTEIAGLTARRVADLAVPAEFNAPLAIAGGDSTGTRAESLDRNRVCFLVSHVARTCQKGI
jgi:hypothetical protein